MLSSAVFAFGLAPRSAPCTAPSAGGVSFTTSPPVSIPGGYKSAATLQGAVQRLIVGGQEFALDRVCAFR